MLPDISPLQARFVHEYLIDLNATQAVKRAGYKCKTDKVAAVQGARLLANVKIQAAIQEARAAREKQSLITVEWVLSQLAEVAQDPEHKDRMRALELLGKHLGMFDGSGQQDKGVRVELGAASEWAE